jgi:hypothetical protein
MSGCCFIGTLSGAEPLTERRRLRVADVPNAIMDFIESEVNSRIMLVACSRIMPTRVYELTLIAGSPIFRTRVVVKLINFPYEIKANNRRT